MEFGNVLMSCDRDELWIIINFSLPAPILPHSSVPSFLALLGQGRDHPPAPWVPPFCPQLPSVPGSSGWLRCALADRRLFQSHPPAFPTSQRCFPGQRDRGESPPSFPRGVATVGPAPNTRHPRCPQGVLGEDRSLQGETGMRCRIPGAGIPLCPAPAASEAAGLGR